MASKMSIFITLLVLVAVSTQALACETTSCSDKPKKSHTPKPVKPSTPSGSCPVDTLKLGVCADLLGGLLKLGVGKVPSGSKCCPLIKGLVDLEAAACLCTVVKADVLGLKLALPVKLTLLANTCGCKIPSGYICA